MDESNPKKHKMNHKLPKGDRKRSKRDMLVNFGTWAHSASKGQQGFCITTVHIWVLTQIRSKNDQNKHFYVRTLSNKDHPFILDEPNPRKHKMNHKLPKGIESEMGYVSKFLVHERTVVQSDRRDPVQLLYIFGSLFRSGQKMIKITTFK